MCFLSLWFLFSGAYSNYVAEQLSSLSLMAGLCCGMVLVGCKFHAPLAWCRALTAATFMFFGACSMRLALPTRCAQRFWCEALMLSWCYLFFRCCGVGWLLYPGDEDAPVASGLGGYSVVVVAWGVRCQSLVAVPCPLCSRSASSMQREINHLGFWRRASPAPYCIVSVARLRNFLRVAASGTGVSRLTPSVPNPVCLNAFQLNPGCG